MKKAQLPFRSTSQEIKPLQEACRTSSRNQTLLYFCFCLRFWACWTMVLSSDKGNQSAFQWQLDSSLWLVWWHRCNLNQDFVKCLWLREERRVIRAFEPENFLWWIDIAQSLLYRKWHCIVIRGFYEKSSYWTIILLGEWKLLQHWSKGNRPHRNQSQGNILATIWFCIQCMKTYKKPNAKNKDWNVNLEVQEKYTLEGDWLNSNSLSKDLSRSMAVGGRSCPFE